MRVLVPSSRTGGLVDIDRQQHGTSWWMWALGAFGRTGVCTWHIVGLRVRVAAARLQPLAVWLALSPRGAGDGLVRRLGLPCTADGVGFRGANAWHGVRPLTKALGAPGGRGVHWQLGWWSTRRTNRTRGGLGTFDAGSGLLQQASVLFQNIVNAIDANPANEQQQRISVSLAASVLRLEIRRYRLGRKKGRGLQGRAESQSLSFHGASEFEREREALRGGSLTSGLSPV